MPVKKYKPVTPGQRGMTGYTFEEITKSKPERSLLLPLRKQGGRNVHGRVTVRHRGGGHRRFIRIVDFKRDKRDIPAKVAAIEYDPNRTARLALLHYADGEKRYILAPLGLKVGDAIMSGPNAEIRPGNACRSPVFQLVQRSTISNCAKAKAVNWYALPGVQHNCWQKKAILRKFVCLLAKFVWFTRYVMPQLVRLVMWITAISSLGKPDANVIWVFARQCAVLP